MGLWKIQAAGIKESPLTKKPRKSWKNYASSSWKGAAKSDYAKNRQIHNRYLKRFDKVRDMEGRFKSGTGLKIYPEIK
jgi:hypothetical protein